MSLLRRAWHAYWTSRPHPVRKIRRGLEIESLRRQGLSNDEILKRIEG